MFSIFDFYKIGVGPSSSHTNGPMLAGFKFREMLDKKLREHSPPLLNPSIKVQLFGSLSLTGKGHHTDKAVTLGLLGFKPDTFEGVKAEQALATLLEIKTITFQHHHFYFSRKASIIFEKYALAYHENGMTISAYEKEGSLLYTETYYSIGGGFIVTEDELSRNTTEAELIIPHTFRSASDLLARADTFDISISDLILENEKMFHSEAEIAHKSQLIWEVMQKTMQQGFSAEGILPGGLNVNRRAPALFKQLHDNDCKNEDPMYIMDWINLFAFAVSEQNAAGGQVVTSPTNGAAGVIPAVLMYYHQFIKPIESDDLEIFFSVSAAIGMLYKMNASISGAEVGCQGEVGVASSMAAAGLTALRGGTNEQICIAAEIAMEHSLGMTCDPIFGLVQVPCIERNAMGAMKAINAHRMALRCTGKMIISLDDVIETMYRTGKDMDQKYRETSLGGLALTKPTIPCE